MCACSGGPGFEALGIARDRIIMGFESPPWNVLRRMDVHSIASRKTQAPR